MAHTITKQTIVDGHYRNTVVKINIKGDGASAEFNKQILFDASDYATGSTDNKLMQIQYFLNGFTAELFWDATTDVPLISLNKDIDRKEKFWRVGGIVNNGAAGRTGDILISTSGLNASTKDGYILLYIKERKLTSPN